jgi:hypothetical protein
VPQLLLPAAAARLPAVVAVEPAAVAVEPAAVAVEPAVVAVEPAVVAVEPAVIAAVEPAVVAAVEPAVVVAAEPAVVPVAAGGACTVDDIPAAAVASAYSIVLERSAPAPQATWGEPMRRWWWWRWHSLIETKTPTALLTLFMHAGLKPTSTPTHPPKNLKTQPTAAENHTHKPSNPHNLTNLY